MQKFLSKQESHSDLHSDREKQTRSKSLFKQDKLLCVLHIKHAGCLHVCVCARGGVCVKECRSGLKPDSQLQSDLCLAWCYAKRRKPDVFVSKEYIFKRTFSAYMFAFNQNSADL